MTLEEKRKVAIELGYSEKEVDAYLEKKRREDINKKLDWIPRVGAGVGGIVAGVPTAGGLTPMGMGVGYGGGYVIKDALQNLLGTKEPVSTKEEVKQRSGEELKKALTGSVAAAMLGELISMITGQSILTKRGVASETNKLVKSASSDETKSVPFYGEGGIQQQLTEKIRQKLGNPEGFQSATEKVLSKHGPVIPEGYSQSTMNNIFGGRTSGDIPEEYMYNPQRFLNTRRQVSADYGKNVFQSLISQTKDEDAIAKLYGQIMSSNLHQQVPETVIPDKLYSYYSKFGTPTSMLLKLIGGGTALGFLKKLTKPSSINISTGE